MATTYTKKFKEFVQEWNPEGEDYIVGYRSLDDSEIRIPLLAVDNSITANKYIRKDIDDYANGLIRFNNGFTVSNNVMSTIFLQGLDGWKGNQKGDFEMNSLILREFLEVPELRKNKITVMGNQFWFTDSAMIKEAIATGSGNYDVYFKLEEEEYSSFELNDILKGIYHYSNGFWTTYLKVYELILDPDTQGEIGIRVHSMNGRDPRQSMLLARISNSSDKERQGSLFADGLRKYIRVLNGYNSEDPTSEGSINTIKVQIGDLSTITNHPIFGNLEGYGLYADNVYLTGKLVVKNDPNKPGQELGVYRGVWNATSNYYKYDQVTYNGSLYTSKQIDNVGHVPMGTTDDLWWELTVSKGDSGTSGEHNITLELTNDNHSIPTDSEGKHPSYGGAYCTAFAYQGTEDITEVYTITATLEAPTSVDKLKFVQNGNTVIITHIADDIDNAVIKFTAITEGYPTVNKLWSIAKVKSGIPGEDSTAYWLVTDTPVIKKHIYNISNSEVVKYEPSPFVIRAFSQTGTKDIKQYDGYIRLTYGSQIQVIAGSSYQFMPVADVLNYTIELFKEVGLTTLLDKEIVTVVSDGTTPNWQTYIFKPSNTIPPTPTFTRPPTTFPTEDKWYDYPNDSTSIWWMSTSSINGVTGVAYSWSKPVKVTGEDGKDGTSTFKSTVFKRSLTQPIAPIGGSYASPVPTDWSDGAPTGTQILWSSTRVFTSDGQLPQTATWTKPSQLTDTASFQVRYSTIVVAPGDPITNPSNWSTIASDATIWMATRDAINGVWGNWQISKIKGEKGEDGAWTDFKFSKNNNAGIPPVIIVTDRNPKGWVDITPTMTDGEYLWMTNAIINPDNTLRTNWSNPIRINGEKGEDGKNGDWYLYIFKESATTPSKPTFIDPPVIYPMDNWYDYPKSTGVWWMSMAVVNGATRKISKWSDPIKSTGEDGVDGTDGVDGVDGTSITWKGTFSAHPANPQNGWAYYNSTDKKSYVYQSNAWYQMTVDGVAGQNGNSTFKSTVFKRTNANIVPPTGGSYTSPVPSGWSDGIPNGLEKLWASTRIFTFDGNSPQQSAWTAPSQMTDTASFQVRYSSVNTSPGDPTTNPNNWTITSSVTTIWMAARESANNVWAAWQVSKIRGEDGTDIVWKGDSATPPINPQINWVYRDTDNGRVYIWNGTSWELMVVDGSNGADGSNGSNGFSVYITYNDNTIYNKPIIPTGNGTTGGWHTSPTVDCVWMSQKVSASSTTGTWGSPIQLRGENGGYVDFKYALSTSANTPPALIKTDRQPSGWSDVPQIVTIGTYLWMISAFITPTNILENQWSSPMRVSGENGAPGSRGPQGLTGPNGLQGPSIAFAGNWSATTQYYGYANTQTCVYYGGKYYYTKTVSPDLSPLTIPSGAANHPASTNGKIYWNEFVGQFDNIATGLLLAERIATAELTTNKMFIVDRQESSGNIIDKNGSIITKDEEKTLNPNQIIGRLSSGWYLDQGVIRSIAVTSDGVTPKLRLDKDGKITATGVNITGTVNFENGTIGNMQVFNNATWTSTVNGPFPASTGFYYLRKNNGVTITPQGDIIGKDYFLTGDSTKGPSVFIGDVYVPGSAVPGTSDSTLSSFLKLFNSLFERVLIGSQYTIKAKLPLFSIGEITAYGSDGDGPTSLWDSIPVDNITIAMRDGKLTVIGGIGGIKGIVMPAMTVEDALVGATINGAGDTITFSKGTFATKAYVTWDNVASKPSWIVATKPTYSYSEITGTPPAVDLSNYVTLNTTQTIINTKIFTASPNIRGGGSLTITPHSSGSNANGIHYTAQNFVTFISGIGSYANAGVFEWMYMGWGAEPWQKANSFSVSSTSLWYKNNELLHAANYNNYAPTKTGGGASGTWGINITGTSNDAKGLVLVNGINGIGGYDVSTLIPAGGGFTSNYANPSYWKNAPVTMSYGSVITLGESRNVSLRGQFAWDVDHAKENGTNRLWFRTSNNLGWNASWDRILTDRNWTSIVDGRYLPLAGGTMTGTLTISNAVYGGQLTINRISIGGNSVISYSNSSGVLGTIGICGTSGTYPNDTCFHNKSGTDYRIWHSGNDGAGSGLDADLLDGYHDYWGTHNCGNSLGHAFLFNKKTLDLKTGYDSNKWYPCWIFGEARDANETNLVISTALEGNKPTWGTHASGFSLYINMRFRGSGWGVVSPNASLDNYYSQFGGETAFGGTQQNTMGSYQIVWLRGGAYYRYWNNSDRDLVSSPSGYSWTSGDYTYSAAPRTTQGSPSSGFDDYITAYTNGNIASATKLRDARTIWGQSFNGTANVTGSILLAANNTYDIGTDAISFRNAYLQTGIKIGDAWLEWDSVNKAIKVSTSIYSLGEVTAYGSGSGSSGGGGGLIQSVYGYSDIGGKYLDTNLTDTFNAYTISRLASRIISLEGGSTTSISNVGSGNVVTLISKSGNVITATKGITAVDTTTNQTITGSKTFTAAINATSYIKSGGTSSQLLRADGGVATFTWSGQSGQPTWLWGGTAMHDYKVYNPSNFEVSKANGLKIVNVTNWTDLDDVNTNGIYSYQDTVTAGRPTPYGSVFQFSNQSYPTPGVNGHWLTQLISGTDYKLYVRWRTNIAAWSSVQTILTNTNYSGYLDGRYVNKAGDTMTGALTVPSILVSTGYVTLSTGWFQNNTDNVGLYNSAGNARWRYVNSVGGWQADKEIYVNTSKVWHAGNDGSGSGLDADLLDGYHKDAFLGSTSYTTTAVRATGFYKIKIKPTTNWMLYFKIKMYQDYNYYDIDVSGYQYGSNYWYLPKARLGSSSINEPVPFYFGYDSPNNLWVAIPASNYTGITITDITNGYAGIEKYGAFTIEYQATLTGTIQTTQNLYRNASIIDNVASATKLRTARAINGTAFDGTSAITTALWGTARILTMGTDCSGSVSVNGSANFTVPITVNVATKLRTARTISLSGSASGSTTYDGSANSALAVTLTGNAPSATILANTRTIWGQNFNGSANVFGALTGVTSINASSVIRTEGTFSAGESADTAYGFINVCRAASVNNAAAFSWVRSGAMAFAIGCNTSNQIVLGQGAGGANKTINPWFTLSGAGATLASVSCSGRSTFAGLISSEWLRTTGGVGWYSESYGGGIYMIDTAWIRTYGGKAFYVDNTSADAIHTAGGINASGRGYFGGDISTGGNILANGEITAYSDIRLKSDISNLSFRGRLSPKTYIKDDKKSIGFIAQEVQQLYPELIHIGSDENHYLSLNYGSITAVLSAQINLIDDEVTILKREVKELKQEITNLKNK